MNKSKISKLLEGDSFLPLYFALFVIGFIVFHPLINNGFVNWDDDQYVLNNPLLKSLDWNGLISIFSSPNVVGNYHPLAVLSLAFDYQFSADKASFYHLHSLILHLINSCLASYLVNALFKNKSLAFFVALLFCIHPLHLESVAWISARKDLLFTGYILLGLISYLRHLNFNQSKFLYASFGLFLLACLSKSQAIVFPFYLLLIDYLKERKTSIKTLLEKVPFFIISIITAGLAIYSQSLEKAISISTAPDLLKRIAIACYSIIWYLVKAIIPSHLSSFHPYPFQNPVDFPGYFYAALLFIPLFFFMLWVVLKRNKRIYLFCLLFFLVSLIPVLQIIPYGRAMLAERYTYLAYFGLFVILAYGIQELFLKLKERKTTELLIKTCLATFFLFLSVFTYNRTKVWENGESLWTDVIDKYPDDYFAYSKRAEYYSNEQEMDLAKHDVNKSISLYSNYVIAYHLKGKISKKLGQNAIAKSAFLSAINLESSFVPSYANLAFEYISQGNVDSAFYYLSQAIELDDNYDIAFVNRAIIHQNKGRNELALADYSKGIELKPNNGIYYRYRGVFFLSRNNFEKALADFNEAIKKSPNDALSYFLRAKVLHQLGNDAKALKDALKAQELNFKLPDGFIESLN